MTVRFNGTRAELADVIRRLASAKAHLYDYFREAELCKAGYVDGQHIRLMCETIEHFLQSDKKVLVVSCPPRHGKSTLFSELLPCWYVSNHPQKEVIVCAYSQTQARKMMRACRMRFDEKIRHRIWGTPSFTVDSADEIQLADKFNGRPNLLAVGVGAGLTGNGADLLICDDLYKSFADASSPTISESIWSWFQSAVMTRLSPTGKCVCVFTRWVPNDVIGRVLEEFDRDMVEYLNLPAISADGKALWAERYSYDALMQIKKTVSSRVFEALYQGNPVPDEGGLIQRSWFQYVQPFPRDDPTVQRVRAWDLAGTHGDGDWTAGVLMAYRDGEFVVEDIIHGQWSPAEVADVVRSTAERDGTAVPVVIEQEGGSSGVAVMEMYARLLLGYAFHPVKPTGRKDVRAQPWIASLENGHLKYVRCSVTEDYEFEAVQFPTGEHDDMMDATSHAYAHLCENTQSAGGFWVL